MKKRGATIYAAACSLLLLAGILLVFFLAWQRGTSETIDCICGIVVSFIFAPILHEMGHVSLGNAMKMRCVYVKCFCVQMRIKKGKKRLAFASPFAADQTQMMPNCGGNMQKRAGYYTLGGLIFSGIFLLVILLGALICFCVGKPKYELWGALPYAAYLFALNAFPFEYAGGKTDALVYRGIKKGYEVEECMVAAMEIHGRLSEGKSFGEIEKTFYFDLPQLCEDEPLYALLLDLRYRYYLDQGDMENAVDCLNRLARSQAYLSDIEVEKIAAELTYMHALQGDVERAEESGKLCKEFLSGDSVTAKRVLLAYSLAVGKKDALPILRAQAEIALQAELILGVRKFEEKLLKNLQEREE